MATQIAIDKSTNSQQIEFGRTQNIQSSEEQTQLEKKQVEKLTKIQEQEALARANVEKEDNRKEDNTESLTADIEEAIETITEFMSLPIRSVNFKQDDGSDRTVIKVFDADTKELIKQFPSDEVLAIAQRIVELRQDVDRKTGILLDEKV